METRNAILNRRSQREFTGEIVPNKVLTEIVADARWTPSWANSQPWKVWIATGESLAKIKQDHLERAYQGRVGHSDFEVQHREAWGEFAQQNMRQWYREFISHEGKGGREFGMLQANLYNAPALVYLTIPRESGAWSIYDLGAFSQTLQLAAFDKGVDSLAAYEIVKFPDSIRQHLGIPDDQIIAMGIALGYGSETNLNEFVSSRVPVEEMLTIKG